MSRSFFIIFVCIIAAASFIHAQGFNTFPPHVASGSDFTDISKRIGLGAAVPLRVSSLVDWRNSKNVDLVGVREDNPSCIEVRSWNRGSHQFSGIIGLTPGCNKTRTTGKKYIAATAVDINRDGLLDIVATHETNVDIFLQEKDSSSSSASASSSAAPNVRLQSDVLKFPAAAGGTSATLLKGSSVNVMNYFGQCANLDIVAVTSAGTMIVFRNALDTPPHTGGETCTNAVWATTKNVTFVPELGTIVKNVVAAASASVDLDGDCAAEFVFATRNSAKQTMEFRTVKPATRNIDVTSTKKKSASGGDSGSGSSGDGDTVLLFSVPDDFGAPTWTDFNGDGAIDVVFPVCVAPVVAGGTASPAASSGSGSGGHNVVKCYSQNNYTGVLVIQNKNSGACPNSECCKKFESYSFADVARNSALDGSVRVSAISYHVSSVGAAAASSSSSTPTLSSSSCLLESSQPDIAPLKLRPGDINDDSKCDAVVSSTCGPLLLRNGGDATFTAELFVTGASTGVPGEDSVGDMEAMSDSRALPFFFDVNDDGRLDLIVMNLGNYSKCDSPSSVSSSAFVMGMGGAGGGEGDAGDVEGDAGNSTNTTTSTSTTTTTTTTTTTSTTTTTTTSAAPALTNCAGGIFAFWHRGPTDRTNYFITATTLNGALPLPNTAWGAMQPGATVRFQHLDIDNDVHSAGGTQIPATAFLELSMPRPHFGIGLTFASVMNFATGFNIDGKSYSNSWPSVYLTPNSQILCVPYPVKDPGQWLLRLYLMGDWDLELVLIAWLVSLTVIGIPILALGVREVHEDRRSFGLA